MFQSLKLTPSRRRSAWSHALWCPGILALGLTLQSCGGESNTGPDNPPIDPPVNDTIKTYVPPQSSDLFKDTPIRQSAPTQTLGGLNTLKVGNQAGTVRDLLLIDSSVVFLDSIPAASRIVSCTLWVKINSLPRLDGDVVSLDLWSIPESWNESEASWNNRTSTLAWQTPGAGGVLFDSQLVSIKKLNLFDFVWTVHGQLYDTVQVAAAQYLPIPISDSLASANLLGQSFGFALRVNSTTSPGALMGITSAEASAVVNRPYLEWRYR